MGCDPSKGDLLCSTDKIRDWRRYDASGGCKTLGDLQAGRCTAVTSTPVWVRRGQVIGFAGNRGTFIGKGEKGEGITRYHLHFEVRKGLAHDALGYHCALGTCVPVDPYGGPSPDPYPAGPNVVLWE